MPVSKNAKQMGSGQNSKVLGGKGSRQSKPADTRVGTLHDWRVGGKGKSGKPPQRDPRRDGQ